VLPLVVLLSAQWEHFYRICGVAVVFSIEFIDKKLKLTILLELFLYTCMWCLRYFISSVFIDGGFYGGGFEN
jgi:hypothetical protein